MHLSLWFGHLNLCFPFTFAVGVKIEDTACRHHRLQGDDLVQRHAEQFVLVETPRRGMVRLMGTEVVMTKSKALAPSEFAWINRAF